MGKNLDDIFAGMDCFEPRKAQDDPLEVLRQTTIKNAHIFILLTLSRMFKDGDVRLEAPNGNLIAKEIAASLTKSLPTTLEFIAETLSKK